MLVTTTVDQAEMVRIARQVGDDQCHLVVRDGTVSAAFLEALGIALAPVRATVPDGSHGDAPATGG